MMWFWTVLAIAAPVRGAVGLEWVEGYTCATFEDGEAVCWQGRGAAVSRPDLMAKLATPPSRTTTQVFDPPREILGYLSIQDALCILDLDRKVWCQGEAWREAFGFPPETPADVPVRVPELDGIDRFVVSCALRGSDLLCPTPAGVETRLTGVKDVGHEGWALLEDGTLWQWNQRYGVLGRFTPKQLQSDVTACTGELLQRSDGTIHNRRGPFLDLVGNDPPALIGNSRNGCALVPGGGVTCWGPPLAEVAYHWPRAEVPRTLPRAARKEIYANQKGPTCELVGSNLTCTSGPTEAVLREAGVDQLIALPHLACFRRGSDVSCHGYSRQRKIMPGDAELRGVTELVSSGTEIFALRDDGEVLQAGWSARDESSWSSIGQLEGAHSLGARDGLVCVRAPALQCVKTGAHTLEWSAVEVPEGAELDAELCFASTCLHPKARNRDVLDTWEVARAASEVTP